MTQSYRPLRVGDPASVAAGRGEDVAVQAIIATCVLDRSATASHLSH